METERDILTETVVEGKPSDRPWEGCINSVVYRVPRGVKVKLPRFLAEHIARSGSEREAAERLAQRYAAHASRLG